MGKKPKKTDRPTTIFFLRHGQPDNPKKIIKGMAPFPLSKQGREQIKKQGVRLKNQKIGAIFTSPALRCQQTAQIVASVLNEGLPKPKHPSGRHLRGDHRLTPPGCQAITGPGGLKIKLSTYLKEWTSRLDGQYEVEANKLSLEAYNQAFEPKAKVLKRMQEFVKMILAKYSGQKIVAVSHQGPIDLLLFTLQNKDISRMPCKDLITKEGEMVKMVFDQKMNLLESERTPPNS